MALCRDCAPHLIGHAGPVGDPLHHEEQVSGASRPDLADRIPFACRPVLVRPGACMHMILGTRELADGPCNLVRHRALHSDRQPAVVARDVIDTGRLAGVEALTRAQR